MILDAQNLHIPSPKAVKLRVCNLTSVSFRRHFLVCSRAEHVKLVLCTSDADFVSVKLPLFRALCVFFGYVALFLYCYRQLDQPIEVSIFEGVSDWRGPYFRGS